LANTVGGYGYLSDRRAVQNRRASAGREPIFFSLPVELLHQPLREAALEAGHQDFVDWVELVAVLARSLELRRLRRCHRELLDSLVRGQACDGARRRSTI